MACFTSIALEAGRVQDGLRTFPFFLRRGINDCMRVAWGGFNETPLHKQTEPEVITWPASLRRRCGPGALGNATFHLNVKIVPD